MTKPMWIRKQRGHSKRRCCAAFVAALLALPAVAAEREFLYSTVDIPGAASTTAMGVNASGVVVGFYTDREGVVHGFRLHRGWYDTIDVEGAAGTQARGINIRGEIVGTYWRPGEPPAVGIHGFLRSRGGEIELLDHPAAPNLIAEGILQDGSVLGCYHGADFMASMFGFVRSPEGDFTDFDRPGSMHGGGTPDGSIVGLYTDPGTRRTYGYLVEDGVFRPFRVPGSTSTSAWDVNADGQIVGIYGRADGTFRGYLRIGEDYTTVHFPGALSTVAYGINARGVVVGRYMNSDGTTHGFLAIPIDSDE